MSLDMLGLLGSAALVKLLARHLQEDHGKTNEEIAAWFRVDPAMVEKLLARSL